MRLMRGVKLADGKNEELKATLGLKETLNKTAKTHRVRWYRHVVRRDDNNFLKEGIDAPFEWLARKVKADME